MTILLDSVILIDHLNSIAEATAYLGQVREEASISVITRAEVLTGFDASDREQAIALLDRFPLLDIPNPLPILQPICGVNKAGNYPMPSRQRLPSTINSV